MSLIDTFVASYAVTLCVLMVIVPLWSESKGFAICILGIAAAVSILAFVAVAHAQPVPLPPDYFTTARRPIPVIPPRGYDSWRMREPGYVARSYYPRRVHRVPAPPLSEEPER